MEPNPNELEDKMIRYIKGELPEEEASRIREGIQNSQEDFLLYISLQEALYLMKDGRDILPQEKEKFLGFLTKKSQTSNIQLIVRFIKDQIIVSSSDQEELNYQGIMAEFSYRGSKPGPVSITREFDGFVVTFVLTPSLDKKSVFLSMKIIPEEELNATLLINGSEAESIRNLKKNKAFETPIPSPSDVGIEFKKGRDTLFSVGIKFHAAI